MSPQLQSDNLVSDEYFELEAVSNSSFTALRKALNGEDFEQEDNFNLQFGTLVDAKLTESRKTFLRVQRKYKFEDKILELCKDLVYEMRQDKIVSLMLKHSDKQRVILRTMRLNYEGFEFTLPCKAKLDLDIPKFDTVIDFKTVTANSYAQFRSAIDHFDWDRQAAFYLDLTGRRRYWIIGISKTNKKVYKYAIERDDESYLKGKAKYTYWGWKSHILFY